LQKVDLNVRDKNQYQITQLQKDNSYFTFNTKIDKDSKLKSYKR
jgi:hypothetical protein